MLAADHVTSTADQVLVVDAHDLAAPDARGSRKNVRIDDPEPLFERGRRVDRAPQ